MRKIGIIAVGLLLMVTMLIPVVGVSADEGEGMDVDIVIVGDDGEVDIDVVGDDNSVYVNGDDLSVPRVTIYHTSDSYTVFYNDAWIRSWVGWGETKFQDYDYVLNVTTRGLAKVIVITGTQGEAIELNAENISRLYALVDNDNAQMQAQVFALQGKQHHQTLVFGIAIVVLAGVLGWALREIYFPVLRKR